MYKKILLCGDVHWSEYSSILRSKGNKFSTRLENLIQTINYIEEQAINYNVDAIFYLGDFFDKTIINLNEMGALQEVEWGKNIPHYFITGNHEIIDNSGISIDKYFQGLNFKVITQPEYIGNILCLPYILEKDRKNFKDYISQETNLILSHNDIAGIQLGPYKTISGFDLKEIDKFGKLFINGHYHNQGKVGNTIYNIGNITGQNFSEDSNKYKHEFWIISKNEENWYIDKKENPYALKFSQWNLSMKEYKKGMEIPGNMVLSITCKEEDLELAKDLAGKCLASKIMVKYDEIYETKVEIKHEDHITKFIGKVIEKFGNTELVQKVLEELK